MHLSTFIWKLLLDDSNCNCVPYLKIIICCLLRRKRLNNKLSEHIALNKDFFINQDFDFRKCSAAILYNRSDN